MKKKLLSAEKILELMSDNSRKWVNGNGGGGGISSKIKIEKKNNEKNKS